MPLELVQVPQQTLTQLAELLEPFTAEVVYPESDGEPMAEAELQAAAEVEARRVAEDRLQVAEAEIARLRMLLADRDHDARQT